LYDEEEEEEERDEDQEFVVVVGVRALRKFCGRRRGASSCMSVIYPRGCEMEFYIS